MGLLGVGLEPVVDRTSRPAPSSRGSVPKVSSSATASRLLLKALKAVPEASAAGVVEELLAAVAVKGHQTARGAAQGISLGADILGLLLTGDIPMPKVSIRPAGLFPPCIAWPICRRRHAVVMRDGPR